MHATTIKKNKNSTINVSTSEVLATIQQWKSKGIYLDDIVLHIMSSKEQVKRNGKIWNAIEKRTSNYNDAKDTLQRIQKETKELVSQLEAITMDTKPNLTSLRLLEERMSKAASTIYTTRVIDACSLLWSSDKSKLHNVKRRLIRVLIATGTKFPTTCKRIVAIMIEGAVQHQNKTRLVSACRAGLEELFRHQRLQVAGYIKDETSRVAQRKENREALTRTLGEWQLKANKYLARTPIDARMWHNIIDSINDDTDKVLTVNTEWCPEDGHVQWVDQESIKAAQAAIVDSEIITHAAWNVNGLKSRYRTGELIEFITKYKPTTLHLSEIKTDLAGIESPWELKHMLHALGYIHCIWNWCTSPLDTSTRSCGNFGTAIFSKIPLENIQYGFGDDTTAIDREGRVITATTGTDTFIWCYTPCSRWTEEESRSQTRKEFDKSMHKHHKRVNDERGGNVYMFGDMNVAPTEGDCSPSINHYPSCKNYEREAHTNLKRDYNLVDVYEELHGDLKENRKYGEYNSSHFTWHTRPNDDYKGGMRLDILLAPRHALATTSSDVGIIKCELADSYFGSDHLPIIATIRQHKSPTMEAAHESLAVLHTSNYQEEQQHMYNMFGDINYAPRISTKQLIIDEEMEAEEEDAEPPVPLDRIFKDLRLLPGPENDLYNRGNPGIIAHMHENNSPIHFTPRDKRLTLMREQLRKGSKYHLTHLNTNNGGLPIISAFAVTSTNSEPVRVLLDSGAMGLFMPAHLVQRLGLTIRPANVSVTIGNNSVVQSTGIALLDLKIGTARYQEEVVVLSDCPYDVIAGTTFFRKYNGSLNYKHERLTLDNPKTGEPIHINFGSSTTRLVAQTNMTIAPRTEAQIPINPNLLDTKWSNLAEEERWGTVADALTHDFKVANGIMRIRERGDGTYNWVSAINAGDCEINIKKGDTIAHFKPLDRIHEIEILHMEESRVEADRQSPMTETEVNEAIEAKPHLKDLDLANRDNNLTKEQQLIIKRLVLKHHTLWDTSPKTVPEHLPR
jgi:exodeoxyribonuclease III